MHQTVSYSVEQLLKRYLTLLVLFSYLRFVVPHADAAVVETGQHPWLGWMKVHTLYSVRPGC